MRPVAIYHAFHKTYGEINTMLDELKNIGISHIQLPPVQPHRILVESDSELIKKKMSSDPRDVLSFIQMFYGVKSEPDKTFFLKRRMDYFLPVMKDVINHCLEKVPFEEFKKHYNVKDIPATFNALLATYNDVNSYDAFQKKYREEFLTPNSQPWWTIYQPEKFEIGDTRYGNVGDLVELIANVKAKGMHIIVDVVLNHLKAINYEWSEWNAYLNMCLTEFKNPSDANHTNAAKIKQDKPVERFFPDSIEDCSIAIHSKRSKTGSMATADRDTFTKIEVMDNELKTLVKNATGLDDLSQVQVPFYCGDLDYGKGYAAATSQECWLAQAKPQIMQTHPNVKKIMQTFVQDLRKKGVSGLRFDAAGHMTPTTCLRIVRYFLNDDNNTNEDIFMKIGKEDSCYSYFEAIGPQGSVFKYKNEQYDALMPTIDTQIGSYIMNNVFKLGGSIDMLKIIPEENRRRNLDSAVCIFTHDTLVGSLQSDDPAIYYNKDDYQLAMAYIIQRIDGVPVLLDHDKELPMIKEALKFRRTFFGLDKRGEFKEFNEVINGVFVSKKAIGIVVKYIVCINPTNEQKTIRVLPSLSETKTSGDQSGNTSIKEIVVPPRSVHVWDETTATTVKGKTAVEDEKTTRSFVPGRTRKVPSVLSPTVTIPSVGKGRDRTYRKRQTKSLPNRTFRRVNRS